MCSAVIDLRSYRLDWEMAALAGCGFDFLGGSDIEEEDAWPRFMVAPEVTDCTSTATVRVAKS